MLKSRTLFISLAIAVMVLATGCTVHPSGEKEERNAAMDAGKSFQDASDARQVPPLPDNPTPTDMVQRALLANAELEQKYWEWRAAIEQIPQDGTQTTNLALSASLNIFRGSPSAGQTIVGAGNDPMADIVLPPKLTVAAGRALENARAAGVRYRKAQLDLRQKVLNAYYDYALNAELIRLEKSNAQLFTVAASATEARVGVGSAGQQELLKVRNELDLSNNDIANMLAQLPAERAALNALMSRPADSPVPFSDQLPNPRETSLTDEQLLALAARQNPEIEALGNDVAGRKEAISLAKLQYLPDISIGASTDLKGLAQTLLGTVTVPWLRNEAIDAAVAQAEANLRAAEAVRQNSRNNLAAQAIFDVITRQDAIRQLELLEGIVLPRAKQSVDVGRSAYESGRLSLLELLDDQRALISIDRLIARLRIVRETRLVDLETLAGEEVTRK